jgi:hypothetical protein
MKEDLRVDVVSLLRREVAPNEYDALRFLTITSTCSRL